jgi:hypothetical protein
LPRYGDHELYVNNTDSRQKKVEPKVIDQQYFSVPVVKPFKRQNRYKTVRPNEDLQPSDDEIIEMVPTIPTKVKLPEVVPYLEEAKPHKNLCECCKNKKITEEI